MSYTIDATVVASGGQVLLAPKGTALPAWTGDTINTAFFDVGAISDNGVTPKRNATQKDVTIWQETVPVETLQTAVTYEFDFDLLEWNAKNIPLAFGGGAWVAVASHSGDFIYQAPSNFDVVEYALIIKWTSRTYNYMWTCPRVALIGNGDIKLNKDDLSPIPVTLKVFASSGVAPWSLLSNNPEVDPA